tara:strand:- start:22 stop:342 length:321 start_codon:yes stop_codon:yes gene_type:complete
MSDVNEAIRELLDKYQSANEEIETLHNLLTCKSEQYVAERKEVERYRKELAAMIDGRKALEAEVKRLMEEKAMLMEGLEEIQDNRSNHGVLTLQIIARSALKGPRP